MVFAYMLLFVTVALSCVAAPSNDNFAARLVLSGSNVHWNASLTASSRENGEVGYREEGSVWWSWTAPSPGLTALTVNHAEGALAVLEVFQSASIPAAIPTNIVDQAVPFAGRRSLTFLAQNRATYLLRLCGSPVSPSAFSFRLVHNPKLPMILEEPKTEMVSFGRSALFTVVTIPDPSINHTIQWQFNEENLPGETFPALGLTNVTPASVGDYRVIISTSSGLSLTSSVARLVFRDATVPPSLTISRAPHQPNFVTIRVNGESLRRYTAMAMHPDFSLNDSSPVSSDHRNTFYSAISPKYRGQYFRVQLDEPLDPICDLNLRQIMFAKSLWGLVYQRPLNAPVPHNAIFAYLKDGAPTCPAGGIYEPNVLEILATCSIAGHFLP